MVHRAHLHGLTLEVFARDGYPLPQPFKCDTINVAPGERWDAIVVADAPGAWAFKFAAADKLTVEEKTWKPGSTCLVTYAGQVVETGAQAECYAKFYIRKHMETSATNAGFPGATYATLGTIRTDFSAQVAAAKAKGDTAGAADTQKKLDAATSLRSTMQTGETLSGLLLTVYGFSSIGAVAGLAAYAIFGLAGLMVVLSIAGFIHAYFTPKDEVVFAPKRTAIKVPSPA